MVNNTRHTANLTGTFSCEALGGVFMVHRGTFQLFNQDPRTTDTTNLTYDFDMQSTSGKELHFYGYKVVNSAGFLNPLELVRQTTTLYVTITDKTSGIVGRGKLHIQPRDFYEEAQTFRTTGASILQRLGSAARFVAYFAENLAVPFLSPLGPLQWPKSGATTDGVLLVARPSQTIHLTASDGVQTSMVMWEPLGKGATTPAPIMLLIPGASVDHTMFALPTIDKNAVTFFREAGYRVYCITHRVGRTMEARRGHTPYDTRHDIRAALARIRETNGAPNDDDNLKIYVVAHCAGSIALACGLLDGTIPARWIRGLTASMVFMNPKFGKVNSVLAGMPVNWYAKLVSPYWDCTNTPDDTLLQRIVNQLLRFYPVGPARETCRSVVCHRSELVFGR